MKIAYRCPAFAPELIEIHLRPRKTAPWVRYRKPLPMGWHIQDTTDSTSVVRQVRRLFRPVPDGLYVVVWQEYDAPFTSCNRLLTCKKVASRAEGWALSKQYQTEPQVLLDGRTLPANRLIVKFLY